SLRNRLKQLFSENWNFKVQFIADIDKFVKEVVDKRNFLTHLDPQSESSDHINGFEFARARRILFYFLKYCLMKNMGIKEDHIHEIMLQHRNRLSYDESFYRS
ncbi:HEPN domain-containing protein, partial [Leptospira wolffii]